MTTKITIEEWVAELDKLASAAPVDGETTEEMSVRLGKPRDKIIALLKEADKAGRLTRGKKIGVRIDGVRSPVSCYWILPAAKKKR